MPCVVCPDTIYSQLEQEIVDLKVLPGDILSENSLCKRFGVSRTPIRSALQRLEQGGFVKIIPHKGTIVTPININIADQFIYNRVAVEAAVFRDFVVSCTPSVVEQVRYAMEMLYKAAEGRNDLETFDIAHFLHVDLSMHHIWFKATDKLYIWNNLVKPQPDYSRFIRLDIVGAKNVPDVIEEHEELMKIIDNKDIESIEPLLKRHLYGGVRRLGGKVYSDEYRKFFDDSVIP